MRKKHEVHQYMAEKVGKVSEPQTRADFLKTRRNEASMRGKGDKAARRNDCTECSARGRLGNGRVGIIFHQKKKK